MSPTPLPTPAAKAAIGDGTWMVGSDIQPGTYEAPNVEGGCYWSRLRGFSGAVQDIIANDNPSGRALVTILDGDVGFKSQGCGTWVLVEKGSTRPSTASPLPTRTATHSPVSTSTSVPVQLDTPTHVPTSTVVAELVPTTIPTVIAVAEVEDGIGDGTWVVGVDIEAGTYEVSDISFMCYWARLKGMSGGFEEVIANGTPMGRAVVTILKTDVAFNSQGCGSWTLFEANNTLDTEIGEGIWAVNDDIKPGTYEIPMVQGNCYWSRLKGFTGDLDQILANGNPIGRAVVTITDTDIGFTSQGCGSWKVLDKSSKLATEMGDGTWIIDDDIQFGTYEVSGVEGNCYWSRLKGFTGVIEEVIANEIPLGRAIVTIANTDKGFNTQGCGTWTLLDIAPTASPTPTATIAPTSTPIATPTAVNPNDSGGGLIQANDYQEADIDYPGDIDEWFFDGIETQTYTITMWGRDIKASLTLTSPSGKVSWVSKTTPGETALLGGQDSLNNVFRLEETGKYTFIAKSTTAGIGDVGSYEVSLILGDAAPTATPIP